MFKKYILPTLLWWFYRSLIATWKIKVTHTEEMMEGLRNKQPFIFAAWHGDELALMPMFMKFKMCTMTSTSKDGQLVDYLVKKFGGATSRGSSTRGAVSGLRGLVRLVITEKRPASLTVDGPKGPIYQVKPGVFELARLTKAHIVPVGARCVNAHVFTKAWNKSYLPLPFTTISIVFGQPWPAYSKNDDPKSLVAAKKLATQIHDARQQALELIGGI